MAATTTQAQLRQGRRRRLLLENLTAYAFIFPAGIILFLFGVFPVLFSFFVSLHQWRRFPDQYIGLGNYERALGNFAYVLFFWLALGALAGGLYLLWRVMVIPSTSEGRVSPLQRLHNILFLVPGIISAAALLLFVRWFSLLLPVVLEIPQRIRGQEREQGLFMRELGASFQYPEVAAAGNMALLMMLVAAAVILLVLRFVKLDNGNGLLLRASAGFFALGSGYLLLELTVNAINGAVTAAREAGTELPVWSQIILISLGAGMLAGSYLLWRQSVKQTDDRRFIFGGLAAIMIMVGGYLLVAEVPRVLASADRNMLDGFSVTVMYSFFSVPFQLAIGLGLAYLLFQKIKGRTFFRMVFFLPYVMPFIATSIVFALLFSHRQDSIINNLVGAVGIPPQKWLLEPTGISRLVFGAGVPDALSGPSLALIVIIIYTVWTYAGYATVVFLAGLGNISGELYEAARIDGASGWSIFRYITLPLLSPTTFFLSLVAVIGTFQAFTQLWMMRTPAASRSVDTVSIFIFRQLTDAAPNYGYGSAVAFVLFAVILLLTLLQNRFAGRRVFYG